MTIVSREQPIPLEGVDLVAIFTTSLTRWESEACRRVDYAMRGLPYPGTRAYKALARSAYRKKRRREGRPVT